MGLRCVLMSILRRVTRVVHLLMMHHCVTCDDKVPCVCSWCCISALYVTKFSVSADATPLDDLRRMSKYLLMLHYCMRYDKGRCVLMLENVTMCDEGCVSADAAPLLARLMKIDVSARRMMKIGGCLLMLHHS